MKTYHFKTCQKEDPNRWFSKWNFTLGNWSSKENYHIAFYQSDGEDRFECRYQHPYQWSVKDLETGDEIGSHEVKVSLIPFRWPKLIFWRGDEEIFELKYVRPISGKIIIRKNEIYPIQFKTRFFKASITTIVENYFDYKESHQPEFQINIHTEDLEKTMIALAVAFHFWHRHMFSS